MDLSCDRVCYSVQQKTVSKIYPDALIWKKERKRKREIIFNVRNTLVYPAEGRCPLHIPTGKEPVGA
jgi:hypothetical protein